jgi:hypothetical protein
MTEFGAKEEDGVTGRIGVAAEEITVVFAFSPAKAGDEAEGLVGVGAYP